MLKQNIAVFVFLSITMLSSLSYAGVDGSRHDFRPYGATELCSTCHVPHKPLLNVPLWAHQLTTTSFYLYNTNSNYSGPNSGAYDASPTNLGSGKSRLCLSCHDGTVAVTGTIFVPDDVYIPWDNGARATGENRIFGLRGNHPVSVDYNTVRANQPGNFNDVSSDPAVKLDAGKVQCTSCHNPHNKFGKMLVKSNFGSAICLTCHNK